MRTLYNQHLRPQLHYSPKKNWMNDPNGCVFFNGLYHLYYQYYPYEKQWGPMHWGHAVSPDLIHWKEQDIALFPDDRLGYSFSGSAAVDRDNTSGFFPDAVGLVAFYTSHLERRGEEPLEQQSLAYSTDQGKSWIPYAGNPVVKNPGIKDFRDPKVFYHAESGSWVLVVVAGYEVRFYRSVNLRDWEPSGSFRKEGVEQTGIWECPDLFSLQDETGECYWILAVSSLNLKSIRHPSTQYFIGQFDGYSFKEVETPTKHIVDYGSDFYAPQSWNAMPSGDGRKVWIGWVNHWLYAKDIPTDPWRGVMSIPRVLTLEHRCGRLQMIQNPVAEVEQLRMDKRQETLVSAGKLSFDLHANQSHELLLDCSTPLKKEFSITFFTREQEALVLSWNGETGTLRVDRSGIPITAFHPVYTEQIETSLPVSEVLDMRILIDRSVVEIFALGGESVITLQIFPSSTLEQLVIEQSGDNSALEAVLWALRSIWAE